jgi:dihydrofolate synthase/folylpolyglutamate synthase
MNMEVGTLKMKLDETAEEYVNRIPMWTRKKNSLDAIRRFLCEMGNPDEDMKIIHVAGTNGKGSVCAFLQSVLTEAGYRVGMFTSPHLLDTRERLCINGEMVSKKAFESSFHTVRELTRRMVERGFCHPSYFEFLFYMAMEMFDQNETDVVILETGLGGRIDITNVIRHPMLSVITSISLDHTEFLGDTIDKIASEKAGIIKKGIPVVFDGTNQEASQVIKNRAKELFSPFYEVDKQDYEIIEYGEKGYDVRFQRLNGKATIVRIPSVAEYQVMNALIAFRTLEILEGRNVLRTEIRTEVMKKGFLNMHWSARMEEILPGIFLDGAHNPGGMQAFLKAAVHLCTIRKVRANVLFSSVTSKDHNQMIKEIAKALPLDQVLVTHIDSDRGVEAGVLHKEFKDICGRSCSVKEYETVEEAVCDILQKKDEEHLCFCVGSLYLMGEIKAVLRRNGYD